MFTVYMMPRRQTDPSFFYFSDIQGIPRAIMELQNGRTLFTGKIIDVRREVRAGFTVGLPADAPFVVPF